MHEETRRRILRAAFLLLCVAPVICVVTCALRWNSSFPARQLERQLGGELGVIVGVSHLSHPRPGQLQLDGIRVVDDETLQLRLSVDRADAFRAEKSWRIDLPEMTVEGNQLPALWAILHDRVVRRHLLTDRVVSFASCRRLTINLAPQPLVLHDVQWAITATTPSHKSRLGFSIEPGTSAPQIQVAITRDRSSERPFTTVALNTKHHALPLRLLAMFAGYATDTEATFQGQLPVTWDHDTYQAQLTGTIRNVPLDRLLPNWLTSSIEGLIDLVDVQAFFTTAGLESGRCLLDGQQVRIAESLIGDLANARLLHDRPIFRKGPAYPLAPDSDGTVLIDRLQLDCAITETGLTTRGKKDADGQFVAARNDQGNAILLSDAHVRLEWIMRLLISKDLAGDRIIARRWQRLQTALPPTLPF